MTATVIKLPLSGTAELLECVRQEMPDRSPCVILWFEGDDLFVEHAGMDALHAVYAGVFLQTYALKQAEARDGQE